MEYLILDEYQSSLTRGTLRNPPDAPVLEFEIPETDIHRLDGHTELQFLGFDEHSPSFHGTVNRRRGNRLAVQKGAPLGDNPLDSLRVPYEVDSFVYPVSGTWTGRIRMKTNDLSCGALAFTCSSELSMQEVVEVAVLTRDGVLLVHGKIIAHNHNPDGSSQYVSKFISGVAEVEQSIRKEVLYLQLKQRDDKKEGKITRKLYLVDAPLI